MRRSQIGAVGEEECVCQLELGGWKVQRANEIRNNFPNVDVFAEKGSLKRAIQVKSSQKARGYITGGGVNPKVVEGGPIFNRVPVEKKCDFVIFLATKSDVWRYFVVPVEDAERIFRRNINSYFCTPKLDGGVKKPYGQADIFVGSGEFKYARIVPDQRQDVVRFENRWDLLNAP